MIISAASDYRAAAQRILPPFLFHYLDGGAYAEHTLQRNVADLSEVALRQRILRNMSELSLETTLFNETLSMPVALARSGCAACMLVGAKCRLLAPPQAKAFLSRCPPSLCVLLKRWRLRSIALCGSSSMCCGTEASCVMPWSGPKRQAALRWCLPWTCRRRARVIAMRIRA